MNKETYWKIMLETNKESGKEPIIQQELIEKRLNELTPDEVIQFDNIYNELMDNAYDWKLWAAAYIINGGCSDDCFIDFRGWLIGQGKEVYTKALADPDSLSEIDNLEEGIDWEGYGYLAFTVYQRKTGKEMPINSEGVHLSEPKGIEWEEDDLHKILPKLSKKHSWQ